VITIVDYGMGNLGSICNMLGRTGVSSMVSSSPEDITSADKLILPGVGHFDKAMQNLHGLGLVDALNEAVLVKQVPILGICLGQQLLCRSSEEGKQPGLGWIPAEVKRIRLPAGSRLQVPHMGWNTIEVKHDSPILNDRYPRSRFYFVHSYQVFCDDPENVLAVTTYGHEFHSAIIRDHIMGVQFHPEKSHKFGYRLLSNFVHSGADAPASNKPKSQLFSRTDVVEIADNNGGPDEEQAIPVRVIPTLLLRGSGLVKTEKFKDAKYVGDPRNAVKIFNEKEVDELALLDIDATVENREPSYDLLAEIITEAFMPIAYGGAIRTLEQARKLLAMGAEKILLNTAAAEQPELVSEASRHFGSQSVVVVMDIKKQGLLRKSDRVCFRRAKESLKEDPVQFARRMEDLGAGEILLQSVDRDGTRAGFDIDLIRNITQAVNIPVIASGGAASVEDLARAVHEGGASAVAAGSLFVFQGRHKAVLISYPKPEVLRRAFAAPPTSS
jgi:cyclase